MLRLNLNVGCSNICWKVFCSLCNNITAQLKNLNVILYGILVIMVQVVIPFWNQAITVILQKKKNIWSLL